MCLNQKVYDVEDSEGNEPSWEKQELMVRRLQKKFPDQDKEVNTHTNTLSFTLTHQIMLRKSKGRKVLLSCQL